MKKLWFGVLVMAIIAIVVATAFGPSPPESIGSGSYVVANGNEQLTGAAPNIMGPASNVGTEVRVAQMVAASLANNTTVAYPWDEAYVRPVTTGRVALNSIQATEDTNSYANDDGKTKAAAPKCLGDTNPPYT